MKNYLKFVEIKETIKFDCDQDCEKLLEMIAVHQHVYEPYTVTQLMNSGLLSPATIHRKMLMLEKADYILLVNKNFNRRTKYLLLSQKADKYFNNVESIMQMTKV